MNGVFFLPSRLPVQVDRLLSTRRGYGAGGGVAEDLVAVAGGCGRRPPAAGEAGIEELLRARGVVPDGDRRHASQSGGVIDEIEARAAGDDDIVGILVLYDDAVDEPGRCRREAKAYDLLERLVL